MIGIWRPILDTCVSQLEMTRVDTISLLHHSIMLQAGRNL